jgi:hypothetical protein
VWDQTKYLYHPWYENAAMVKLYLSDPTVQTFIQTEINSSLFNSYLKCDETEDINQNIQDLIKDDLTKLHWLSERSTLYSPGDLLINLDPLKNTTVIGSEMDKIADPYKTF